MQAALHRKRMDVVRDPQEVAKIEKWPAYSGEVATKTGSTVYCMGRN